MPRTADDAVDVAMEVVWRLKNEIGAQVVVSTRPPGIEVVLGKYSLRRRITEEETDIDALVHEVCMRVERLAKEEAMEGT